MTYTQHLERSIHLVHCIDWLLLCLVYYSPHLRLDSVLNASVILRSSLDDAALTAKS